MIQTATFSDSKFSKELINNNLNNFGLKFKPEPAKPYKLSIEQQNVLDSQLKLDKNLYADAEMLYNDLKNKYEL